jgi:hypothetical protein
VFDQRAIYETKRVGSTPVKISFTIEQAKQAGLTGKDNWRNYPAAMLRARRRPTAKGPAAGQQNATTTSGACTRSRVSPRQHALPCAWERVAGSSEACHHA